jgi:hypothetical protein
MDLALALRKENEKKNALVERGVTAANIADKLFASLKPRGTFNIPMLLDERRFEYGIPNGAFASFPAFDKVYVHQIPLAERKTYADDGVILKPDAITSSDRNTAPRGIIVSAGLGALDSLRSSGFDVGHIIRFKKFSPFIQPVDEIDGVPLAVMVIRDGDIVSSEDLAEAYHARRVSIVNASADGLGYDHRFARVGTDGEVVTTGKKVSAYYDPSV